MKSTIFNSNQISAYQDGTLTAFLVKMKQQPEADVKHISFNNDVECWVGRDTAKRFEDGRKDTFYDDKFAPFTIGQTIAIRERFLNGNSDLLDDPSIKFWVYEDGSQLYSDGKYSQRHNTNKGEYGWQPASRMPLSAARYNPECVGVECVRIQAILSDPFLLDHWKDGTGSAITAGQNLYKDVAHRFGQSAWDENHWVYLVTIKKPPCFMEAVKKMNLQP